MTFLTRDIRAISSNMSELLKNTIKRSLNYQLLGIIFALFSLVVLSFSLNNNFTYPDTYKYISYINSSIVGTYSLEIDFLTLIKPFSAIFVQFLIMIGSPGILNAILISLSCLIVFKSYKTRSISLNILIPLIYILNGNFIYWYSKYSAEFLSVLLISLLLYSIATNKSRLAIMTLSFLILTRSEFLLISPLLGLIRRENLKGFIKITLTFTLIFGIVASFLNEFDSYIKNILLALIIINGIGYLFYRLRYKLIKIGPGINIILKFSLLVIIILYLFSITRIYSNEIFNGVISASILMFGLVALYIMSFKASMENYLFLLIMLILSTIYIYTSFTSFRYFVIIAPLMLFSILNNAQNIKFIENIFIMSLLIVQISFTTLSIPWSLLNNGYWHNRFESLNSIENSYDYIIVSSTPIISSYYGYKSEDICNIALLPKKSIVIVDEYSYTRCSDTINSIYNKLPKPIYYLYTESLLNIEKYTFQGQKSEFFILQ